MSFRRMLPFLLLNILVSAAVMLGILWWWDGRQPEPEPVASALAAPSVQESAAPAQISDLPELPDSEAETTEEVASDLSSEPGVHVVQTGDTLGQISLKYDISVEAIMAANNMDNPNFLAVGAELVIPEEGAPLPEPEADEADESSDGDTADDELPTPIPTAPAGEGEVSLVISDVSGAGLIASEAIQIVNNGSREASLRDWKITDQLGNTYTFGQLTLFGDGAGIALHSGTGQDSATDLFWGLDEALWESGDRVVLYDDAGTVQAEFEVP